MTFSSFQRLLASSPSFAWVSLSLSKHKIEFQPLFFFLNRLAPLPFVHSFILLERGGRLELVVKLIIIQQRDQGAKAVVKNPTARMGCKYIFF